MRNKGRIAKGEEVHHENNKWVGQKKEPSLGGLEPPTFRLTAERANRLRHRDWYGRLGKVTVNNIVIEGFFLRRSITLVGRQVAWPSGLRRWFKAPVSSEAWVRIPPLPFFFSFLIFTQWCFDIGWTIHISWYFPNCIIVIEIGFKALGVQQVTAGAVAKW